MIRVLSTCNSLTVTKMVKDPGVHGSLELFAINSVPFYLHEIISSGLDPDYVYLKMQEILIQANRAPIYSYFC